MAGQSEIVQFFSRRNVLFTGATGFLGKVLLEKILRTCDDVGTIYLTIRTKKGCEKEERLKKLFESEAFSNILHKKTQLAKVTAIGADFSEENLGLSSADVQTLISNVDLIIHCAATVNFNEKLKKAIQLNVKGVQTLLTLAERMEKLKVFVHVSTAYSFSNRNEIGEMVYEPRFRAEDVIRLAEILDEETAEKVTPALLDGWPNTYTLTKAISETILNRKYDFPIAIVRPSIVTPSDREPHPGWVDSLLGPMGIMLGFSAGLVRSFAIDTDVVVDCMPVDFAVNTIIAAGWDVTQRGKAKTVIYNCVSSSDIPMSWRKLIELSRESYFKYPSNRAIWYPAYVLSSSDLTVDTFRILLHRIPAKIADFFAWLGGHSFRMSVLYDKVEKHCDSVKPFTLKEYKFENGNTKAMWNRMTEADRELFYFNMENFDFRSYIDVCVKNVRYRLLREKPESLPQAKRRLKVLRVLHYSFVIALILLCLYFLSLFCM